MSEDFHAHDEKIKAAFKAELAKFSIDGDWFEKSHDIARLPEDQLSELRIYDAALMAMRHLLAGK